MVLVACLFLTFPTPGILFQSDRRLVLVFVRRTSEAIREVEIIKGLRLSIQCVRLTKLPIDPLGVRSDLVADDAGTVAQFVEQGLCGILVSPTCFHRRRIGPYRLVNDLGGLSQVNE